MISNTGIIAQMNEEIKRRKTYELQSATTVNLLKKQDFFNPWGFQNCIQTPEAANNLVSFGIQLILGGGNREVYECEKHTDFFFILKTLP